MSVSIDVSFKGIWSGSWGFLVLVIWTLIYQKASQHGNSLAVEPVYTFRISIVIRSKRSTAGNQPGGPQKLVTVIPRDRTRKLRMSGVVPCEAPRHEIPDAGASNIHPQLHIQHVFSELLGQ